MLKIYPIQNLTSQVHYLITVLCIDYVKELSVTTLSYLNFNIQRLPLIIIKRSVHTHTPQNQQISCKMSRYSVKK